MTVRWSTRVFRDLRLVERRVGDAEPHYTLERIRTRPYELRASWNGTGFDSLRIALDDASAEGFPASICRTDTGIVGLDSDGGEQKRGTIRAVVRYRGRTIDLQIEFDLPVHVTESD